MKNLPLYKECPTCKTRMIRQERSYMFICYTCGNIFDPLFPKNLKDRIKGFLFDKFYGFQIKRFDSYIKNTESCKKHSHDMSEIRMYQGKIIACKNLKKYLLEKKYGQDVWKRDLTAK